MKSSGLRRVKTDVLVVGGGLAGCWAALGAKEHSDHVTLVDKAMVAKSGCSTFAAGVMLAPLPEDDLNQWAQEIVENGEFMNDQDWVRILLAEQVERISQMEEWGFPVEREPDGSLARIVGRGHRKTRVLMFHGEKLMAGMRKQVLLKDVELMERIMITDLLMKDGPSGPEVMGAIGCQTRTGEWVVLVAKAVVLCSGQVMLRNRGGYIDNLSGDGLAMAYRAGAVLSGMEFAMACNITCWQRRYTASGINMFQGHGAYIINAKAERFMERYDPILKERSRTCTLGPAFTKEALEGRGPIYVDMRHLKPEVFEKFARVIPKTMQVFKAAGIDPSRQPIECSPTIQCPRTTSGEGGIRCGLHGETNIPGLFAAGAVTHLRAHGTFGVGGLNLANCCVLGYRVGQTAAKFAKDVQTTGPMREDVLARYMREVLPGSTGQDVDLEDILKEIKKVTIPARYSFFKHARRIHQTLGRIAEIETEVMPRVPAGDAHHLVKSLEMKNYLACARLLYKSALLRQESRGTLFREEFPNRDDVNWLKWIVVRREGNEDKFEMEPIPLEKYPFKPKSLEPIPYPVQYYFEE